jgi:hypothetical protein
MGDKFVRGIGTPLLSSGDNAPLSRLKRKPANHFAIFSLLLLDSLCLNCARVRAVSSTISNRNKL